MWVAKERRVDTQSNCWVCTLSCSNMSVAPRRILNSVFVVTCRIVTSRNCDPAVMSTAVTVTILWPNRCDCCGFPSADLVFRLQISQEKNFRFLHGTQSLLKRDAATVKTRLDDYKSELETNCVFCEGGIGSFKWKLWEHEVDGLQRH